METSDPGVSVILCTRNRARWLPDTLNRYADVKASVPWELVVVDNGSTDETPRILQEFAASGRIPLRVVNEPRPGLSRARNQGLRVARGQIIAFSDDDCYPSEDYIDQLWQKMHDTGIDYLGGRVLLYDPEDFPITIQTDTNRYHIEPHSLPTDGRIHGANMAAQRTVFAKTGGFDELLGAGGPIPAAEDTDWLARASAAGFRGLYEPDVFVFHHHRRRSNDQVESLRRSYDVGRGAYYVKCLLDRTRRKAAARSWYWSIRARLALVRKGKRSLPSIYHEFRGALKYATLRAAMTVGMRSR